MTWCDAAECWSPPIYHNKLAARCHLLEESGRFTFAFWKKSWKSIRNFDIDLLNLKIQIFFFSTPLIGNSASVSHPDQSLCAHRPLTTKQKAFEMFCYIIFFQTLFLKVLEQCVMQLMKQWADQAAEYAEMNPLAFFSQNSLTENYLTRGNKFMS